jgi:hypothetical protein
MTRWTQVDFLRMCILAGCDYEDRLTGIGIKMAHSIVDKNRTFDGVRNSSCPRSFDSELIMWKFRIRQVMRAVAHVKTARLNPRYATYSTQFLAAERTFLHQRVYDPITRTMVHRTPFLPAADFNLSETEIAEFAGESVTFFQTFRYSLLTVTCLSCPDQFYARYGGSSISEWRSRPQLTRQCNDP